MSAADWRTFGASVTGPAHTAAGLPNQDAWAAFCGSTFEGLVVADGLGSKPRSDVGSRAACLAVARAAEAFSAAEEIATPDSLLDDVRQEWLDILGEVSPDDASTTCLFALLTGDGVVRLGALGDGCAAVAKTNGTVVTLMDDKRDSFSNQTTSLSAHTRAGDWLVLEALAAEVQAIVLLTDGVADDLDDADGFVLGLVHALASLPEDVATRDLADILTAWPVPKHSDDKTIACLVRKEGGDA